MQWPGEPPRTALFKNHMPSPSCNCKSKLLRKRTKISLTSSPLARLLYEPALQKLCSMLVASYQVLMGQVLTSLLCNPSQGASSSDPTPAPTASSLPAPEPTPRLKWQHPSPDLAKVLPPGGATPQANVTGPPSSK